MAAISDYLEQAILNHWLRNTAMAAPPANVYIALFTSATADDGTGTEVTGGAYARAQVSTTGGFTAPGAGGSVANAADITFPTATAAWGTITHAAIMTASSGGNSLWHGALGASKAVGIGDVFKILAGQLTASIA